MTSSPLTKSDEFRNEQLYTKRTKDEEDADGEEEEE